MERFSFSMPAAGTARRHAAAGCVASGDLEILLEPAAGGCLHITVMSSVNGGRARWRALFERALSDRAVPAGRVEIHDFGATPGVVRLRLAQIFTEAGV
ncbi:malonate decarboxylase subunit delta [Neisseria leonii]|uniref:Malonate decarboxylase acyl carrier protein n=1 Tax=Neisseria leonii TaxID=2995413 RepID=A0A9X4IBS6_9NEIS|nr:malonate decarboxylase subunit delta [Neisseria sp. 51.81]MDD9328704.1 malonate decarboxylase subunit delta [Neisseria sp. 51.81]